MSTPTSLTPPAPNREETNGSAASADASSDYTVVNRQSFSKFKVTLSATPGAVFLSGSHAGQIDGNEAASSRGLGERHERRWGRAAVFALALTVAVFAGYGIRGWRGEQNMVEPRGYIQVDKGSLSSPESTRPFAADMSILAGPTSTKALLPDFDLPPDNGSAPQPTLDLKAEPTADAASKAIPALSVTDELLSERDLWPDDDAARKADPEVPLVKTVTENVMPAPQAKKGKAAAPVTQQIPVSSKTVSCPAELSALQLCSLNYK